jgi:hypothetical protein
MRYFDVPRHRTRRIEPHLGADELNAVLVRDFNRYTWGLWRKRLGRGMCPHELENCMPRTLGRDVRGEVPEHEGRVGAGEGARLNSTSVISGLVTSPS